MRASVSERECCRWQEVERLVWLHVVAQMLLDMVAVVLENNDLV